LPDGPSASEPASVREDLGGGGSGQRPVEPAVELGDIGGGVDLAALVVCRFEIASFEDLEDAFGLGPKGALLDALLEIVDGVQDTAGAGLGWVGMTSR
jgi:hypothetical protein